MIARKIEALAEEDRKALQYATIEGEEFTSAVLAGLLGTDDIALEERLDRLDRVHRLIGTLGEEELPDGTLTVRYRFAHVLYRDVLYGELVGKRQALLHRQAGELLVRHYGDQAPRIAAQLAIHFERGREFGRAAEYFIQGGRQCRGHPRQRRGGGALQPRPRLRREAAGRGPGGAGSDHPPETRRGQYGPEPLRPGRD